MWVKRNVSQPPHLWVSVRLPSRLSPSGSVTVKSLRLVLAFCNTPQLQMGRSPRTRAGQIQFKICTAHRGTFALCQCAGEGTRFLVSRRNPLVQSNLHTAEFDGGTITANRIRNAVSGTPVQSQEYFFGKLKTKLKKKENSLRISLAEYLTMS